MATTKIAAMLPTANGEAIAQAFRPILLQTSAPPKYSSQRNMFSSGKGRNTEFVYAVTEVPLHSAEWVIALNEEAGLCNDLDSECVRQEISLKSQRHFGEE